MHRTTVAMSTTNRTHPEPRLYDVDTGRGYLGNLSRETFYKLVRTGELSIVKIGRRTFVDRAELDRFIEERKAAA